jgi:hypothetical protein
VSALAIDSCRSPPPAVAPCDLLALPISALRDVVPELAMLPPLVPELPMLAVLLAIDPLMLPVVPLVPLLAVPLALVLGEVLMPLPLVPPALATLVPLP